MFRYLKAAPTTWVMQFSAGKPKRRGVGLSFWYWAPTTTLVQVPVSSADLPFAFSEVTADFQSVTVQGQVSYRVADPERLSALLDFSVSPTGVYRTDDPTKLQERLASVTQTLTRGVLSRWALRQALVSAEPLCADVLAGLRKTEVVQMLGLEVAREALQRQSDQAIYDRRNAAVEQERRVKESELQTEVMVELKRRHIRETTMAADIAMEKERTKLLEERAANERTAADAQAYALEATLAPLRTLDPKTLQSLSVSRMEPASLIAAAFRDLAENAQKIGELNMSPDLLRSLLAPTVVPAPSGGAKPK